MKKELNELTLQDLSYFWSQKGYSLKHYINPNCQFCFGEDEDCSCIDLKQLQTDILFSLVRQWERETEVDKELKTYEVSQVAFTLKQNAQCFSNIKRFGYARKLLKLGETREVLGAIRKAKNFIANAKAPEAFAYISKIITNMDSGEML